MKYAQAYTDGSYSWQQKVGGYGAVMLFDGELPTHSKADELADECAKKARMKPEPVEDIVFKFLKT